MNKIISILLVGLLGFLGCSGSDAETSPVTGEAIPVAPFGSIGTTTPTYKWTPVPGATRYRLLVQDANETAVTEEWYSAEDAGCASEDVLCMVTPDIEVSKENTWMVQACTTDENCALSEPMMFFVLWGFRGTRFYISDYDEWVVYDSYKGLFWTRVARTWPLNTDAVLTWEDAISQRHTINGTYQNNWRLPTVWELTSLYGEGYASFRLPPDHPFKLVAYAPGGTGYWASTEANAGPDGPMAFVVRFIVESGDPRTTAEYTTLRFHAWCVRDWRSPSFGPSGSEPCQ